MKIDILRKSFCHREKELFSKVSVAPPAPNRAVCALGRCVAKQRVTYARGLLLLSFRHTADGY